MKYILAAMVVVGCAKPQYLGADLPAPCRSKDIEGCLGWMVERDLVAAELGVYDDHELRAYVQGVVDRLVPGSLLKATPRVLIADRDGTYATIGGRIVVARPTLEQLGSEAELAGVLAHELAHIRNRDTLIQAVAAAIGGAITYLGYMLLWFGGDDDSPLGLIASLALVLLAPIAASIIQLSISRQREYSADATGAQICGNPESLASALLRLEAGSKAIPMKVNESTECLYIVKPLAGGRGKAMANLFSTHPPIEERVRRLRQMRPALG